MPSEIWRPVRTAPNYEVSNLGAVRRIGGKLRKLSRHASGYMTVQLRHCRVPFTYLVHRLVADAFIGPSDSLVDHRNTNRQDNRVDNLRYATTSQNAAGRKPRGKTTSVRPVPKQDAVWRTVPNWPEYKVSSCGCVKREMVVPGSQGLPLRTWTGSSGYLQVALCQSGKKKTVQVHTLVAAAFHGPCPKGYIVDHADHDKLNNAATNLEYVTPSQNAKRFEHTLGVTRRGRAHAKLDEESVAKIKERIRNGEQLKSIRCDYPVAPHTLSAIKTGRTWRHV